MVVFLNEVAFKRVLPLYPRKYEPKFAKYGYSLIKGFVENEEAIGAGQQGFCCFGSDILPCSGCWRLLRRSAVSTKGYVKRAVKKTLARICLRQNQTGSPERVTRAAASKGALGTVNGR